MACIITIFCTYLIWFFNFHLRCLFADQKMRTQNYMVLSNIFKLKIRLTKQNNSIGHCVKSSMPSSGTNWHQWLPSETLEWIRPYAFLSNNTEFTTVKNTKMLKSVKEPLGSILGARCLPKYMPHGWEATKYLGLAWSQASVGHLCSSGCFDTYRKLVRQTLSPV